MKQTALFSFVMLLAAAALSAQTTQNANAGTQADSNATKVAKRPVSLSGEVGRDGRTFVADADNRIWQVQNPDTLRGTYGQHVVVRCKVDTAHSGIQVLTVKTSAEERTWAKLDDAAFRR